MQEFSAQQVDELIKQSDKKPFLLDVREPWEHEICHIDGVTLIPMKTIPQHLAKLAPTEEIVVICHHGIRSRMVGRFLEQEGYKHIINLSGGVKAWAEQVDATMPKY